MWLLGTPLKVRNRKLSRRWPASSSPAVNNRTLGPPCSTLKLLKIKVLRRLKGRGHAAIVPDRRFPALHVQASALGSRHRERPRFRALCSLVGACRVFIQQAPFIATSPAPWTGFERR